MPWQEQFLKRFGPGMLGGIALGAWLRVLRDNRCRIDPSRLPRALAITCQALQNSLLLRVESWRFDAKVHSVAIPPPLVLLGHWRSGTTHLHNLTTVDDRFAFPNNYQVMFPHAFLTTEAVAARLVAMFLPPRRPMDNIEWSMQSPQEDEFVFNAVCGLSPCMGWSFRRRQAHYDKYLTFRDVSTEETEIWLETLLHFARKLTWKYGRPLALKSPAHTARIALLLRAFPEAQFVHIHRHPYAVFQSMRRMLTINFEMNGLQRAPDGELDEWILRQYRAMHEAFFEQRRLIPAGRFHEMRFERLEKDPIGEMRAMYSAIELPEFAHVEVKLRSYVESIADYRKNEFDELSPELRGRIAKEWGRCFDEWGYEP